MLYPRINRAKNNIGENCGGMIENVLSREELDLVLDMTGCEEGQRGGSLNELDVMGLDEQCPWEM